MGSLGSCDNQFGNAEQDLEATFDLQLFWNLFESRASEAAVLSCYFLRIKDSSRSVRRGKPNRVYVRSVPKRL
ncbi:hypothetical protein SUGI_0306580 [Cryptomeria japonica]|nr:hypothetical protein SUGI_0306580 [Cryptomeria japonica]